MVQSHIVAEQGLVPAPISPVWIVGFAGHRTGIDPIVIAPAIEQQLRALDDQARRFGGSLHFYSSVADGADMLALDCADRLGLPLHVVLPVPERDFFAPFPHEADRLRAEQRLAAVRSDPTRHTWRLAPTSMHLPEAYFEADTKIVEVADVLMVVWDGEPEAGLGGTAQIVELARAKGTPLIWIHKTTGETRTDPLPTTFWCDPVVERLARYGLLDLRPDAPTAPEEARAAASHLKKNFSAIANSDARWFRHSAMKFLLCNFGAAVVAALGSLQPHDTPWQQVAFFGFVAVELALLLWALRFKYGGQRKRRRAVWVDARMAADLWRSLHASQPLLDPLHPLMAGERRGLDLSGESGNWRRFALTVALLLQRGAATRDWRQLRDGPCRERLRAQIDYFRRHGTVPTLLRIWERLAQPLLWAAPAVVLGLVIYRVSAPAAPIGWRWTATLLPVFLPLMLSLPDSLKATLDLDRREKRYPDMVEKLKRLESELAKVQTEESLRQLVVRTESLLLDELVEWKFTTSRIDPN